MQVYGIDLSKEKFDASYLDAKGKEITRQVKNKLASITRFLSTIPEDTVLCAEHTGVYGDLLVYLCNRLNVPIALVSGYSMKHSLGMVKGKSDPLDSKRIREYGERFLDKLEFTVYDEEIIAELKQLYTARKQLKKSRKSLVTSVKGCGYLPLQSISAHHRIHKAILSLDEEIAALEMEIEKIILSNQKLKENYEFALSVKGVGPIIVTDLMIKTGNFEKIDTARKASSYAGVCPFPNASGQMLGKSRTSPFADKELKSLLFMGARSAVKHNKEYKLYYERKRLEGKHHYVIMNNVSNKLLRTIYSVVKNRTKYNLDHICLDPRENSINRSNKKVA